MRRRRASIRRAAGAAARFLERTRRLLANLLFLVLLGVLVALLLGGGGPRVPDGAVLEIEPNGILVEEVAGHPGERALLAWLGRPPQAETAVEPLVEAIDTAAADERIVALHLDLDGLLGGGLSKLEAVRAAVERFRAGGKTVVVSADYLSQGAYYVASAADEIHLHPMGIAVLTGYGSYRRYYREAIDRLEVDWNVFRVGEYKSAVEPYLRDDMSPEAREARLDWLGDLWGGWLEGAAAGRGLASDELRAWVERFPERLAENGGDAARTALAGGLVDRLSTRDEVRARLAELAGDEDAEEGYRRIGYGSYREAAKPERREGAADVALVVASGSILDGRQPPGTVGGDSTAELLRRAREDERVRAVVLRVDSPGGSAFASEIIRREVELLRQAGKPVVASMSSVAASGGYWISMSADEIWASPTTLTGSIGIYAMVPTVERTLGRFGIHVDGVGTAPLAGSLRLDRTLPEEARRALQSMIEQGYREFVTRAAEGRSMEVEAVDRVARGRVWSGEDAVALGLVDRLGTLDEALASAAERAGLGDDWGVRPIRQPVSTSERLLEYLLARAPAGPGRALGSLVPAPWLDELAGAVSRDAAGVLGGGDTAANRDPRGWWAHCYCGVE